MYQKEEMKQKRRIGERKYLLVLMMGQEEKHDLDWQREGTKEYMRSRIKNHVTEKQDKRNGRVWDTLSFLSLSLALLFFVPIIGISFLYSVHEVLDHTFRAPLRFFLQQERHMKTERQWVGHERNIQRMFHTWTQESNTWRRRACSLFQFHRQSFREALLFSAWPVISIGKECLNCPCDCLWLHKIARFDLMVTSLLFRV